MLGVFTDDFEMVVELYKYTYGGGETGSVQQLIINCNILLSKYIMCSSLFPQLEFRPFEG